MQNALRWGSVLGFAWLSLGIVACQDVGEQRREVASLQTQVAVLSQPSPTAPPTATSTPTPKAYCRQFEASRPTFPTLDKVPPTNKEAEAIERMRASSGTGSAQQLIEHWYSELIPPRVAYYYLPFRGYEQANAKELNQRATNNLLRLVGYDPVFSNPYTDFLKGRIPRYAALSYLAMMASPDDLGDQESTVAWSVVAYLRGNTIDLDALRERLRNVAQRYSAGSKPTLRDSQYCFMVALDEKPASVVDYMMDINYSLGGDYAKAQRRVYEGYWEQYLNKFPSNPNLTFLEYALR